MSKRTWIQTCGSTPIAMPDNIETLISESEKWIKSEDLNGMINFFKSDVVYSSKVLMVSSGIVRREVVTRPFIEALYIDKPEAFNHLLRQINESENEHVISALLNTWNSLLKNDPKSDLPPGLFELCSDASIQAIRDKLGDMEKYANKLKHAGIPKGAKLGNVHYDVKFDLNRLAAINNNSLEAHNPIKTALLKQELIKSLNRENETLTKHGHSPWIHAVVHICAILLGGGLPYVYHRIKTGYWGLFARTDSMLQVESVQKAFDASGKRYTEVMAFRKKNS